MPIESIHRKLDRVRPPRVHITYDVDSYAAAANRELPFVVGVIGDFSAHSIGRQSWRDRHARQVDWDNFNDVMGAMLPRVCFKIPSSLTGGDLDIDLTFAHIQDFEPTQIIAHIEILKAMQPSTAPDDQEHLRRHLDAILHAPEFQELESAWRGLRYLLSQTETSEQLKVKLIDVTKNELIRDLQKASSYDQSILFKKAHEEPCEVSKSEPFAVFIGCYSFSAKPDDVHLLTGLATIAAECHAPFLAAADPAMFGVEDMRELLMVPDLSKVFASADYNRWKLFRQSDDARYVGLVLPRILMRSPYVTRSGESTEFTYSEDTSLPRYLLWGNSAFALGACIANAFARYGWCGSIRGFEGGGRVEGLPTCVLELPDAGTVRMATDCLISDRREREFEDLGFISLCASANAEYTTFFSVPSCCQPKVYVSDAASANGRLSCRLQYILTSSRFMHYLKVIARESIGSYHTRGDRERLLNSWISQYVAGDDSASPAIKARFPLREARIEVAEDPGRPGQYRAVAFLRPHYQLDELTVSLRLTAELG